MEDIDALIEEAERVLSEGVDLPLEDLQRCIDAQKKPDVVDPHIEEIVCLCLFYEDLLNNHPEASSKSLFAGIVKELRERLRPHRKALKFLEKHADGFFTADDCLEFVHRLHEKLLKIEAKIGGS